MRIIPNGRRVGNGDIAVYFQNRAYFTKRGLTKSTILHELYHHLVYSNDLDIAIRKEEEEANLFAKKILNRSCEVVVHQRNSKRLILQQVR
jgi:hypothetical protein